MIDRTTLMYIQPQLYLQNKIAYIRRTIYKTGRIIEKAFVLILSLLHYLPVIMEWLPIIALLLIVQYTASKESVTYQVSGIELVDLIRGFKPKDNVLNLTKVDGDPSSFPDGIYFKPEDEALTGTSKYLHYNGQEKNSKFGQKTGISHDEHLD